MILDMLSAHNAKEKTSFHMPGHNKGRAFCGSVFASAPFIYDTTELDGTDALVKPQGAILEAERFVASVYGATHSFFLVNGATGGILTMIYSAFQRGDTVLVDRFCHQSVLHACQLAGVTPVYLMPEESALAGIPGVLSAETVAEALGQYPEAKGLVLTSPNYYGAAADLTAISKIVHAHGGLLLVDEAHGAHFPFSDRFPKTAMEQGADMSVVSLHKTMPSPNQTALLHIAAGIDTEEVRQTLRMFQTTSPSYVFLAAMEQAVQFGKEQGREKTEEILNLLAPLNLPTLDDPMKRLPTWENKGLSGDEIDAIFREKFGIYAELSTAHGLLLMCSWFNNQADIDRLKEAIDYCNNLPDNKVEKEERTMVPFASVMATMPLDAVGVAEKTYVALQDAVGKICAKPVSAFPPCIPILLPGEVITKEQVRYLTELTASGKTITGLENGICIIK